MKSVNTDVAYDYIRKRILSGEYEPGHPLMTELLANEIKVSRTPVRDALRKLETDGLVTIRARVGASVAKMGLKEYREMCDLRLALESHAAGLAALNRTETDLAEMRYALKAMQELTKQIISSRNRQSLRPELVREDVRFHIAVMSGAKNTLIKKEILRFHLITHVISRPESEPVLPERSETNARLQVILAKHNDIYEAIAASDYSLAKKEMESHIQEMIEHRFLAMARTESGAMARELTPDEWRYQP